MTISLSEGGGEAGVLRTSCLLLACPKCASIKNAASCTLFSSRALPLYCSFCKISTMSSRWQCSHHESWLQCPFHRDQGFRCRSSRLARHSKPTLLEKHSSHKAMLKRLSRIGQLGQHSANTEDLDHSISAASIPKNKKNFKNIRMHEPPRVGAWSTIGLAFRILQISQNPKRPGLQTTTLVLIMMVTLMFVILSLGSLSLLHLVQGLLYASVALGAVVQKLGQSINTARSVTGKCDSLRSHFNECAICHIFDVHVD
jgi:hypothetical protein